ncbi:MAG: autotransporter outer membrane beta-barrel domain-containing protein [Rickettsiales bacterium]|jgi:outer membrane autotransporter protein|nr:autotransporter outer membrane beta-barrel domain-containing protein [Rickettsiales bacterium]
MLKIYKVSTISIFSLLVALGANAATNVSDFTELKTALLNADTEINLTSDITFGADITNAEWATAASSYAIVGENMTLDGDGLYSGLQNTNGILTIGDSLTLSNFNSATAGGAIRAINLDIGDNATFTDNETSGPVGGTIGFQKTDGGTITYTIGDRVKFDGNSHTDTSPSGYGGGAIGMDVSGSPYPINKVSLTIGDYAEFTKNSGASTGGDSGGGAIFARARYGVTSASEIIIGNNAIFSENEAARSGGAIYNYVWGISGMNQLTNIGTDAEFSQNTSGGGTGGGAIYHYGINGGTNAGTSTINIGDDSVFDSNTSAQRGGAIYAGLESRSTNPNSNITLNIGDGVVFRDNTAQNFGSGLGGAIYMTVKNNVGAGGAGVNGEINITTTGGITEFSGNTAKGAANDIYIDGNGDNAGERGDINIDGVSGETIFGGGIANKSGVDVYINKTHSGILTFEENAINENFDGMFNMSGGTTNVYGQFFNNAIGNNITGGTINFWGDGTDYGEIKNMHVHNVVVSLKNYDLNNLKIANVELVGTNNFDIDIDGATEKSDQIIISTDIDTNSTATIINLRSFGMVNDSSADSFDVQVFKSLVLDSDLANVSFSASNNKTQTALYEYSARSLGGGEYRISRTGLSGAGASAADMPALNLAMVKTGMNELTKRLDELTVTGGGESGLYFHPFVKRVSVNDHTKTTMNLGGIETGFDLETGAFDDAKLYIGAMGGFMYADNIKIDQDNEFTGGGNATIPSAGLYATYVHDNGWFANASARYFWTEMQMKNIKNDGTEQKYDASANFITGVLSFGKNTLVDAPDWMQGKGKVAQLSLQPRAEVIYAKNIGDGEITNFGNMIKYGDTTSLQTRMALKASLLQNGLGTIYSPFIEGGIYREWMGATKIKMVNDNFVSDMGGNGFDVRVGINIRAGDATNFYGDVSYDNGSVFESVSLNMGTKIKF